VVVLAVVAVEMTLADPTAAVPAQADKVILVVAA
jgi:hypothetical protein